MKINKKDNFIGDVDLVKKSLMMMRLKLSSGELILVKDFRIKRKEVARLLTKINHVNV